MKAVCMKSFYKFLRFFSFVFLKSDDRRKFRQRMDRLVQGDFVGVLRNNYAEVLERLKSKKGKYKAVFLVSENQKWNWQSVYDDMLKSDDFEPLILITNMYEKRKKNIKLSETTLQENYDFFASRNMKVEFAYDAQTDEYLPLSDFGADFIFYQQPWNIHPVQSIEETSKYALSCYVPYGIPVCEIGSEYDIDFYRMVWAYFEINNEMYDFLEKKDIDLVKNHIVAGHPKLDTYFEKIKENNEDNYIIYAPHHSFFPVHLNLATFQWNGEYILQYAKEHPEFKFVFKPHPWLKATLIKRNIMTKQQAEKYYEEWEKVGIYCDDADYFNIFKKSRMMVTDCASFLIEYFPSGHPVIHLRTHNSPSFIPMVQKITDCYYQAYNLQDLKGLFNQLLEKEEDSLKEKRLNTISEMNFSGEKTSARILKYLRECLGE